MENNDFSFVLKMGLDSPLLSRKGILCGKNSAQKYAYFIFSTMEDENAFLEREVMEKMKINNLQEIQNKIKRWLKFMFDIRPTPDIGNYTIKTDITGKEEVVYPKSNSIEQNIRLVLGLSSLISRTIDSEEELYFIKAAPGTPNNFPISDIPEYFM